MRIQIALLILTSLLVMNCNSSKNRSDSEQKKLNPVVDTMSPGTALVEFEVIKITPNQDNETSIYEVKILNVLKYGPNTPLIDKGSVSTLKLMNNKYEEILKKGTKTAGILSHEKQIAQNANKLNWKLLYLKN